MSKVNKLSRRRLIQLSGAGAATAAAGCMGISGDGSGGGGGTINMLTDYTSKPWQTRWEDVLIPGFEEQSEYTVEPEYVGFQGTGEGRLQQLIQSGDTPESYFGTLTQQGNLIVQGYALTVADVIEAIEGNLGSIIAKDSLKIGGDFYLVPHGIYAGGTFNYRQDIYDKLSLDEPQSWDDLLSHAQIIDEDSDIQPRGYAQAGQKTGKSGSVFNIWLRSSGASYYRYKSDAQEEAEIWFPEEEGVAALEFVNQLADYSPDPSSINWGPSLGLWASNRISQQILQNGWCAGVAAGAGVDAVAKNTQVAKVPTPDGKESSIDRGWLLADGTSIIDGESAEGAKQFFEYAFGTKERSAKNLLLEPMRFLAPADSVFESDGFQNAEIFQKYDGHLLDIKRKMRDEIVPTLGSDKIPATLATNYSARFFWSSEMVNKVVVQGQSPQSAYEYGYEQAKKRLEEGKQLAKNS